MGTVVDHKTCLVECKVQWHESKLPNNVETCYVTMYLMDGITVGQVKALAEAHLEAEFEGETCTVLSVKRVQGNIFSATPIADAMEGLEDFQDGRGR